MHGEGLAGRVPKGDRRARLLQVLTINAMPVRLKDIARDLGVSVVTVSKVLRNHNDISEDTRDRVLKRTKELNYHPNLTARALVTGRSHLIGLIVPDLVHAFFAEVAKGVSGVLRAKGYGLVIASSEEDPDLEKQEIAQMLARRMDALIIASTQKTLESFRRIKEQNTPYILVDRKLRGLEAHFIGTDDVVVGALATEHLIDIGCRRIAFIGGRHASTAVDRLEGYRNTLAEHSLPVSKDYVVSLAHADNAGDATGYEAMKDLLRRKPRPDGVFCVNDPVAIGAMKAILEAGLDIPGDIAVVGAGNVRYASDLRVPLTTVDQQSEQLGQRAAKLALNLIQLKKNIKSEHILLEPKLLTRESSARAGRPSRSNRRVRNGKMRPIANDI